VSSSGPSKPSLTTFSLRNPSKGRLHHIFKLHKYLKSTCEGSLLVILPILVAPQTFQTLLAKLVRRMYQQSQFTDGRSLYRSWSSTQASRFLPKRLADIRYHTLQVSDGADIIASLSTGDSHPHYAALSHWWGSPVDCEQLQLLTSSKSEAASSLTCTTCP
jgi:hypothetical protein